LHGKIRYVIRLFNDCRESLEDLACPPLFIGRLPHLRPSFLIWTNTTPTIICLNLTIQLLPKINFIFNHHYYSLLSTSIIIYPVSIVMFLLICHIILCHNIIIRKPSPFSHIVFFISIIRGLLIIFPYLSKLVSNEKNFNLINDE